MFGTSIYVNNGEDDKGQAKTFFANAAPDDTYKGLWVKVLNGDVEAYFNALRARSDFDLISSPKVMALNNQEASLSTGEDVGYPEDTIIYTSSGQTKTTVIKFLKAATELKFTPHISQDGQAVPQRASLGLEGVPDQGSAATRRFRPAGHSQYQHHLAPGYLVKRLDPAPTTARRMCCGTTA